MSIEKVIIDDSTETIDRQRSQRIEAETSFSEAFADLLQNIPAIPRDAKNNHHGNDYATKDQILKILTPYCAAKGFALYSYMQPGETAKSEFVNWVLSWKNHKLTTTFVIEAVGGRGNVWHEWAAAETYKSRRALVNLFGLAVGEEAGDFDGFTSAEIEAQKNLALADAATHKQNAKKVVAHGKTTTAEATACVKKLETFVKQSSDPTETRKSVVAQYQRIFPDFKESGAFTDHVQDKRHVKCIDEIIKSIQQHTPVKS